MNVADGGCVFLAGVAEGFAPDEHMTVSQWADAYRYLPTQGASEPGPWRTSRAPYTREIMDVLGDEHPAREVVFMAGAQVSKTETGLNWIGHTVDRSPSSALIVQPTIQVAERFSRQRLAPMIAASERLRRKIASPRNRDSGNTVLSKEYPGGILIIGGANSAASLSSMPIKRLHLDEVDRYPHELENEGDPCDLAIARTVTYWRRKVFMSSTPTVESLSRINRAFKSSDQRFYHVPCPHCDGMQVLRWGNLTWPEDHPEDTRYACEHCGALIEHHEKTRMLAAGEWRATHPGRAVVGFHLSALYSPIGLGKTWAEHAAQWDQIKHDPARVKVFTNVVLGECHEDPSEKLDADELKNAAEPYALRSVPPGYLLLTAGCDVQKDRLEILIIAWAKGERCAVVDWHQVIGDPTRPEVWAELDTYLQRPIRNSFGVDMKLSAVAIDSGYLTDDVANFARPRRNRGVLVVKGSSIRGRQIISRPNVIDFNWRGATIKRGCELYTVGTDTAKSRIFARLAGDRKSAIPSDRMVRFSEELPEDFYLQLSAEIFDPHLRRWIKIRPRNEVLDGFVYAIAASLHPRVRVNVLRPHEWDALAKMYEPGEPQEAAPESPPQPDVPKPMQTLIARPPRRGGWVNSWRR